MHRLDKILKKYLTIAYIVIYSSRLIHSFENEINSCINLRENITKYRIEEPKKNYQLNRITGSMIIV